MKELWTENADPALCWGWNGVWKLEYTTPFYTWLLKNV
jgi:hypothetical protein